MIKNVFVKGILIKILIYMLFMVSCTKPEANKRRVVNVPSVLTDVTTAPKSGNSKKSGATTTGTITGTTGDDGTYSFNINESIKINQTQIFIYQDGNGKESSERTQFKLDNGYFYVKVDDGNHAVYTINTMKIVGSNWDRKFVHSKEYVTILSNELLISPNAWDSGSIESVPIQVYLNTENQVVKIKLDKRIYYKRKKRKGSSKTGSRSGGSSNRNNNSNWNSSSSYNRTPPQHEVKAQESWSSISKKYNIKIEYLQAINPRILRNDEILKKGDIVYLK